jgi:L-histidine N-alpha-methyltransferase
MSYAILNAPKLTQLGDMSRQFAGDGELIEYLTSQPRKLHSSLCYDEDGGEYFARLCKQPEYYPAHVERNLLFREAENIARLATPAQVLDLGSGNMEKAQILLHEVIKNRGQVHYIPCDIDDNAVRTGMWQMMYFYDQNVKFTPVHADFNDCIAWAPRTETPRLYTFLGITFGNLSNSERRRLLRTLYDNMAEGDYFLLSVDLVKDRETMESAYRDSAGFLRLNILQALANLNDQYGAEFEMSAFDHEGRYEADRQSIVEYVVSRKDQQVPIKELGITLDLEEGERIETEFSEKFVLVDLLKQLDEAGFSPAQTYMDVEMKYALLLLKATQTETNPTSSLFPVRRMGE